MNAELSKEIRMAAIIAAADNLKNSVRVNVGMEMVSDILVNAIDAFLKDVDNLMKQDII